MARGNPIRTTQIRYSCAYLVLLAAAVVLTMSEKGPPPSWVRSEMAMAKIACSTTTTEALKRTAAHTSTGRGAKPSVRCPGARVRMVAVISVRPCASSSMRCTPNIRPGDRKLSRANGASRSTDAAWDGTTRLRVRQKCMSRKSM